MPNKDYFKEILDEYHEDRRKHPFKFNFHSDWDSFSLNPMNWRDFEIIKFTFMRFFVETNNYSKYFELEFALLGFHFDFDWYR
jgi:hypothetical protein